MPHLKNKSEINRSAADVLQKQSFYPCVVHSAYYSCVQLMKHVAINKIGIPESQIPQNSTHEFLINTTTEFLKAKSQDWRSFLSQIGQLKKLRNIADYDNVQIDSTKGSTSLALSDNVRKHLKSIQ